MSPREFLQGKWLGHPLHPALVHVPTGLWPAALVFDALNQTGDPAVTVTSIGHVAMARCAFCCIAGGLVASLGAVPTGLADFTGIKREKPAWKLAVVHFILNVIIFIAFLVNL